MTNYEVVQLGVQLDTSDFDKQIMEAIGLLEGLETTSKNAGEAVRDALNPGTGSLQKILTDISNMAFDLDMVASKMQEIVDLMAPREETWLDGADGLVNGFVGILDGFNTLADARMNVEGLSEAIDKGLKHVQDHGNSTFNILTALFPETQSVAGELTKRIKEPFKNINWESIKGVIPNFWENIKTKIIGDINSLGDSTKNMLQPLGQAFSNAGKKMKDFGSAVGTAFSNFGTTIAQLARSTGTWIANTAAKVANTTAQWAQVAATTAWNGICAVGTAVTTAFGAAMSALTSPIGLTVIAIVALIAIIVLLVQNFDLVKEGMTALWEKHLQPLWDKIGAFIQSVGDNLLSIWNTVLKPIIDWVLLTLEPVVLTVINGIVGALDVVLGILSGVVGGILGVLDGLIQFIAGVFAGDWDKAWGGIVKIFEGVFEGIEAIAKGAINGIIWIINMLIGAIYSAIARVVNGIGGIVSGIGSLFGQEWGFSIPANPPQISYLAKGAVLPANKPFLAMVGDQRHGTNVEAPLATIQEAVALVMEDQFNGMMAGFEAVTARQEQILETLMGIEIGDTTIGQAAMRYNRKMAIIKGGYTAIRFLKFC